MTTRRLRYAGAVVLVLSLVGASLALASGGHRNKGSEFRATLIGYNEVPSLNSPGHAKLALTVTDTTITFTLEYADLTGPPAAAHAPELAWLVADTPLPPSMSGQTCSRTLATMAARPARIRHDCGSPMPAQTEMPHWPRDKRVRLKARGSHGSGAGDEIHFRLWRSCFVGW